LPSRERLSGIEIMLAAHDDKPFRPGLDTREAEA
jgi:hypothetical protein